MVRRYCLARLLLILFVVAPSPAFAGSDIVLRASDARTLRGNWYVASDSGAAGGQYIGSTDYGWGTTDRPFAQPNDYVEFTFDAPSGTPFHVWFRSRAQGNSKYNDSFWVQYSDARSGAGDAVYRIGTTDGLDVNLERCSGCGTSGWGWQDGAYWVSQATTVSFASGGTHTIRLQIREDGVQIDQIVLSQSPYLYSSPGSMTNDATIVPLPSAAAPAGGTSTGAYLGSPVALPGRVEAENFDNGPDGVVYHDNSGANSGGAYRQTNADIEVCAEGGHNLGWIEAGEWMNYSVSPSSSGSYVVKLRVASPGGGSLHLGFNGPSSVWTTVAIPATGGWQNWTTVNVPATLGAGSQLMTLVYDTGGFNVNYIDVVAGSGSVPPPPPPQTPVSSGGTNVTVVTWNVKIDSSAWHAQQSMDYLMSLNDRPQVIVLTEAYRSSLNTYVSQLQARTGQTWQSVFQNHCPPGAWNGGSCAGSEEEGVAVLTSLGVLDSSRTQLPYADQWHSARALVRVAVNAGGVALQVFGTHLQSNAPARYSSMAMLKSYAGNYSAPQIVGGDFNADQDQIDTTAGMYPNFVDSWKQVGSGNGFTANTPWPTMKLDYLFDDASGRATPNWSVVLTNFGTFSDHYPVLASFVVR